MDLLWLQLLEEKEFLYRFSEYFSTVFQIHPARNWILNKWFEAKSHSSIYQFCDLIESNRKSIERRKVVYMFDDKNEQTETLSKEILVWSREKMQPKLEQLAMSNLEDSDLADEIWKTIEILDLIFE
ncbi:MAG: hypothetical protein ACI85I_002600 [Arenicella sp.]